MTSFPRRPALVAAAAALHLAACGGSSRGPAQSSATVGPSGATLQAGTSSLSIPANALAAPTLITLREVDPHQADRTRRVEVEPAGLALSVPALLVVQVTDANVQVKLHGDDGQVLEVEVEDAHRGLFKTSLPQLGAVEVEVEPGRACTPACGASEECDDGVCKPHLEDTAAPTCPAVCASGLECDNGVCKPHGGHG